MTTKVKSAEAKAKKEKAESVAADKALKLAKAEASKKHIALKNLATSNGNVKKGAEFSCTDKELSVFKKAKAV